MDHCHELTPDLLGAKQGYHKEVMFVQRLHNALLPRLISGALRVKDVRRIMEQAE